MKFFENYLNKIIWTIMFGVAIYVLVDQGMFSAASISIGLFAGCKIEEWLVTDPIRNNLSVIRARWHKHRLLRKTLDQMANASNVGENEPLLTKRELKALLNMHKDDVVG